LCPYAGRSRQGQGSSNPCQGITKKVELPMKPGLYANIAAKRARIKAGSGERMRKPGTKGAPTAQAFKRSARTAKRK